MTHTARNEVSTTRTGINIFIGEGAAPVVSDTWSVGGWNIQFVRLDAGQSFALNHSAGAVHIKVVTGRLVNIDRGAYAEDKVVRNTKVTEAEVVAGPDGAVFTVFTGTSQVPNKVTSMNQLAYSGPLAEHLSWITFEERYHDVIPFFDGLDCYLSPGFHLLDADGEEITYMFVWTAGKGVDLSTHNHGHDPAPTRPAFAEVHWVLQNGTGNGGMYETSKPGAPDRARTPLLQGDEHGPFFMWDKKTSRPILRENGAVEYPWHGWQGGTDTEAGQSYDVVAAFEITAPYAIIAP